MLLYLTKPSSERDDDKRENGWSRGSEEINQKSVYVISSVQFMGEGVCDEVCVFLLG